MTISSMKASTRRPRRLDARGGCGRGRGAVAHYPRAVTDAHVAFHPTAAGIAAPGATSSS